jgi:hypothetical protein
VHTVERDGFAHDPARDFFLGENRVARRLGFQSCDACAGLPQRRSDDEGRQRAEDSDEDDLGTQAN